MMDGRDRNWYSNPSRRTRLSCVWRGLLVECSFAWMARSRRLAKDFERLPKTVEGLPFAFSSCIMLARHIAESA